VDIANDGVAGESGAIRIGTATKQTKTFIAGIVNTLIKIGGGTGARPVVILPNGQLGVTSQTTTTARAEVQKQQYEITSLKVENQQQNGKIASLQAENQALKTSLEELQQAMTKLAVFVQAKVKSQPQKAIYRP